MGQDYPKDMRKELPKVSVKQNGSTQSIPTSDPSTSPLSRSYVTTPLSPNSTGSLGISPHRSMLKALASRSSSENLRQQRNASQTNLSDLAIPMAPFAARFAYSPCFFHKRFDDAVNVNRVLEEIVAEGDGMSHSRLMQTATSVREISKQLQRRPIKRAVRTIMIVTKARDNKLVYLTRELAEFLLSTPRYKSDVGVTVYVDAKLATSKRFDAEGLVALNPKFERMLRYWTPDLCRTSPEKFDLVLTLGGDGTVLYTSWLFQRIVPPILSFSLGSLGFLTNFAYPSYKPTLDRIMEGSGMRVNMRMRFTCTVYRSSRNTTSLRHRSRTPSVVSTTTSSLPSSSRPPSASTSNADLTPDASFEVLNELVLDRGPSPYVSNLELYGDTHLLTIIQADGCIISTPTGSTAYSLSAGGPLCHPSIPGILLTPICPHTLSFRPMVLSDTLLLRLVVPKNSRSTAYASFDGKGRIELRRGDEVHVEAGRYPFPTVVGEGGDGEEWFESVRRALRWNTRGVVQAGWGPRLADLPSRNEDGMGSSDEGTRRSSSNSVGVSEALKTPLDLHGRRVGSEEGGDDEDAPRHGDEEEEVEEGDEEAEAEEEEEDWDIDPDPIQVGTTVSPITSSTPSTPHRLDSGIGGSVLTGGGGGGGGGGRSESEQVSPARKSTMVMRSRVPTEQETEVEVEAEEAYWREERKTQAEMEAEAEVEREGLD